MARDDGFDVQDLIACYRQGVFPMADARDDARIFLIDPERRGILPLERFHVPKRLARTVRVSDLTIKVDTAFEAVVEHCAAERRNRPETWINRPIQSLYCDLYRTGVAHSVECWRGGDLVGGLYGVALQGAFFGESMFSFERDASKVALCHLAARLIVGGYRLLDAQFMTDHLAQFGAREIVRSEYRRRLAVALKVEADFYRFAGDGAGVLQAISQAS